MNRKDFIKGSAILGFTVVNANIMANAGMYNEKSNRKIYRILNSDRTKVGTLPIIRAFAGDHLDYVSPYVLFDEFGPVDINSGDDPLRVDAHPHAGVIPTTYFLDGNGHHKDSLNHDFQIGKGEFMMFSSGSGAIHMEETGQQLHDKGGLYHGFQIWLNMPKAYKQIAPTTNVFKDAQFGTINHNDFSAKVILGELFGEKSQIELLSPAFYYHIELKAGKRIDIPTDPTHNAFTYLINGALELEEQKVLDKNQVVLYQRGESTINLMAKEDSSFLVMGGKPLDEVVYAYGPFVMNSKEEIEQCYRNYRTGKMGDPYAVNK